MSRPIDCCRLYFTLRNRAWERDGSAHLGTSGLIDVDHELEHPDDVGLTRREMLDAMRRLEEAHLIHGVTPSDERRIGLEHHEHRVYVEAVDDLTVATLMMSSC